MKKILMLLSFALLINLTGCSSGTSQSDDASAKETQNSEEDTYEESQSNSESEILNESESIMQTESENTVRTEDSFPDVVKTTHQKYNDTLERYFSEFEIGEISKEGSVGDNSAFYKFKINVVPKTAYTPVVTFYESDGLIKDQFNISLSDQLDNTTIKDIIKCSIISINPSMSLDEADVIMKELVNSFEGLRNSDVCDVGEYKVYITSGSSSILTSDSLKIIHTSEINPVIDTSNYTEYSSDEFSAPLNQGELVRLTGNVLGDYVFEYSNGMEVSIDNEKYIVYYNFSDFPGIFKIGETYTFYGQISKSMEGYSGCMRLDYFEQ